MSNAETLQQHNSKLNVNNTNLNSILDTINNLPSGGQGGGEQNVKITNAQYLFYKGARTDYLNEILALCDNVTIMESMFSDCSNLTKLDLSKLDTSNTTNMRQMFEDCSKLTELNVKNFNTAKVTNMSYLFAYCYVLKKIDLSNFDTSNVTNMTSMFYACNTLRLLDIRNFTFDKVTSYSGMFHNVPANCEIIVKSNTEKEWVLARRSDLTNVKTVAELGE